MYIYIYIIYIYIYIYLFILICLYIRHSPRDPSGPYSLNNQPNYKLPCAKHRRMILTPVWKLLYTYIYIYICIYNVCICICMCIYIYIHIHTHVMVAKNMCRKVNC